MEPPAREKADVGWFVGCIKSRKHVAQLLGLACWNSTAVTLLEQPFQPLVPEALDHVQSVTRKMTADNLY